MVSSGSASSGSSSLAPGTVLDGKYEILGLLGAGGMGEVYKARHVHLHAFRCIKVMKAGLLVDESYRSRFLREARLATQIHHPNIAGVYDFEIGSMTYMVTEYIDGTTLRQWSAVHGRFPLPLAADVAVQVLTGLDHIHRRGLLHRDISADNVMLAYDSEDRIIAKIIDLGVAKDTTVTTDTTQTGMMIGNPKYMSPEQLGDLPEGEQLDGRADLYCLGVVLYEMVTGVPPFVAKTPSGYIVKHLMQLPPHFSEVDQSLDFPEGLETVMFKTLEKDRRRRFPDARAFAAALEPFLARAAGTYSRSDVMALDPTDFATLVQAMPTEIASAAAISDDDAFRIAWEDGSPEAWRKFLASCDEPGYASRAQALLHEAEAFEAATSAGSETGLRDFLRDCPEGRHHLEAEIRLAELRRKLEADSWARAVEAGTFAAMRDFLARYPSSSHLAEAQPLLAERLAFETAAGLDSERAWIEYLETWSASEHADRARERLEAARAVEGEMYRAASVTKTSAAWKGFLDAHPSGARSPRAESNRREALAYEAARDRGREEIEEFLRRYPDGLFTRDARRIAHKLADEDDLAHANALDTAAAWRLYMTAHPGGAGGDRARERLLALEDAAYASLLGTKSTRSARAFIDDFQDSPRRAEVERLMSQWSDAEAVQHALDAVAEGDADRAVALLSSIRDVQRRAEVEAALETARDGRAWNEAASKGTAPALKEYLEAWPSGRWASEARKRATRLEASERADEPRDWETAWEKGTATAWDAFLARHASSSRADEARRCRREAVEFEQALTLNTMPLWRAFLNSWPEGRHRLDAEVRLRSSR
jgi:serine/threonine protein kinase